MPRYKLTIEYNGTNFIGWQKQKKGFSIQETIEKAAKNFLQKEINLTVAGRTDAGVHAEAQIAHLDILKKLKIKNILFGLNFFLHYQQHKVTQLRSLLKLLMVCLHKILNLCKFQVENAFLSDYF